jgi:O-antigen/teichoic acid export membrane protein
MSFFAPVSTSLLDDGSGPVLKRAFYHARVVGNFAFIQAAVQILAFSSGILLVRWLPQREYAYFTIANTMQATLNLLADIGISVGLISIGGRVWQDRHRFGELIKTGLSIRRRLAFGAAIIDTSLCSRPLLWPDLSCSCRSMFLALCRGCGPTFEKFKASI